MESKIFTIEYTKMVYVMADMPNSLCPHPGIKPIRAEDLYPLCQKLVHQEINDKTFGLTFGRCWKK